LEAAVLWMIAFVLVLVWMLGVLMAYTVSGFIHLLLIVALITLLLGIVSRRRVID
jgi:hypothetical protein